MKKHFSKLPKKLNPCPIQEALLEIKFEANVPSSVILGIVYPQINSYFNQEPIELPILQLPEHIRKADKTLKYVPYYKFQKGTKITNIGPNVISFANFGEYKGWEDFSLFIYQMLEKILSTNIIHKITNTELRYINVFKENIFDFINLAISLESIEIKNEPTEINTIITAGNYKNFIRIGNSFDVVIKNKHYNRSIIDINCVREISNINYFLKNYKEIIEEAHSVEKEMFYKLLKSESLSNFNPLYESEGVNND